jgi:hypothetical protein
MTSDELAADLYGDRGQPGPARARPRSRGHKADRGDHQGRGVRGGALGLAVAQWASALLSNSLGGYEEALTAAERASEHPEHLAFFNGLWPS